MPMTKKRGFGGTFPQLGLGESPVAERIRDDAANSPSSHFRPWSYPRPSRLAYSVAIPFHAGAAPEASKGGERDAESGLIGCRGRSIPRLALDPR